MTRNQREKLNEIMGYLWAKSDDALCAGYAEDLGNMLADDEKVLGDVCTDNTEKDCTINDTDTYKV